ncbi:hypothetical protein [Serratia sp. 14-2641]|uniref:hypothetical protein n=1 Tax=Serratia sp. 14-2641 TaxID=1841657 RepID=UPI000810015D|nr:hypothetical protein [Serratia sp. 14-2641]OCJ37425.1 hypothetical protein A6U95_25290 [Serratia sp. 14-2641]
MTTTIPIDNGFLFGYSLRDCLLALSLFVSFCALLRARSSFKNSRGDSELKLYEIIAKSENDFLNFNERANKNEIKDEQEYNIFSTAYRTNILNAYDIACQRYIDGKLDVKRFKKTYRERISSLFSDVEYIKIINSTNLSFVALKTINEELNNQELSQIFLAVKRWWRGLTH